MKSFKCVKVDFSEYGQEMGILRRTVWGKEEDFDAEAFPSNEVWLDDFDKDAIHFAVFDKGKIVASARVGVYYTYEKIPYMYMMEKYKSFLKLPVASFNRLVVDTNYRGKRLAKLLDVVRIKEARRKDCKIIVGQAVPARIKALKKMGFDFIEDIGSYKILPNVELSLMIMKL